MNNFKTKESDLQSFRYHIELLESFIKDDDVYHTNKNPSEDEKELAKWIDIFIANSKKTVSPRYGGKR
jgi:hypothetical protein